MLFGRVQSDVVWTSEDRAVIQMWGREQSHKCVRCGTFDWEWEANEDAWHVDHYTCDGCYKLDGHVEHMSSKPGKPWGRKFGLFKTARGR